MNRWRPAVLLVVFAVAGCGGGPKYATVTGTVTLDGRPLAYAGVYFNPAALEGKIEAPGPGSLGITDDKGQYSLVVVGSETPGAVVGEHRVRISTRGVAAGPGENTPFQTERLPLKYNTNSELKFTVKAGEANVADFDLKSR